MGASIFSSFRIAACGLLFLPSTSFARTPTPTFGNTPTRTRTQTLTPTSNRPRPAAVVQVHPNPAVSGTTVSLDARASTGRIHSYRWSGPPEILIEDPFAEITSFVAPEVTEPTTFTIRLELTSFGSTPGDSRDVEVEIVPPGTVEMLVGHATGSPGSTVAVDVTLRSLGEEVVAVDSEVGFGTFAFVFAAESGAPDCNANPELSVETESFTFLPEGCAPEVDCVGMAAKVTTETPIPDGSVVYQCRVFLSAAPIDPRDSCEHKLTCVGTGATNALQEPLDIVCRGGSARAEFAHTGLSFEISVDPPVPKLGELVRIRVAADADGGRPVYELRDTHPFLEGDTSQISRAFFNPIEYELRAVCPGKAAVRSQVSYETTGGCPGGEVHHRVGGSESFEVEILDRPTYSINGAVAEFPGCSGAMRGVVIYLSPLGLSVETDLAHGGFDFDLVPPGDYTLTVSPSCNPFGCWPPTKTTVTDSDVSISICPIDTRCPSDCNDDGVVGIDEVVAAVRAAVEDEPPRCNVDVDADGHASIYELLRVVRASLRGCSQRFVE